MADDSLELTPEEQAAEARDRKILQAVRQVNKGISPQSNERSCAETNELEYWSSLGNLGKVKLELQKGADVNARGEDGYTALHGAAENGHLAVVRLLIDRKADKGAVLASGETPLLLAQRAGHTEVVRLLEST